MSWVLLEQTNSHPRFQQPGQRTGTWRKFQCLLLLGPKASWVKFHFFLVSVKLRFDGYINPHGSYVFPCSTSRLRPLLRHGVRSRGGRKGKGRLMLGRISAFYGGVVRWENHRTKNWGDAPAMFEINFLSAGKIDGPFPTATLKILEVSLELHLNLYMYCLLRLFTSP